MGFAKKVMESGAILNALMIIGFLGVIWLMIYGNLSGNLGFSQDTGAFANETITLSDSGAVPAGASGKLDPSLSNVVMTNSTSGFLVITANYTVSGATFTNLTDTYGDQLVNVSYTILFDSPGQINTDGVINNLTFGAGEYYGFFPTIMIISAIVLLITILVGLLFLVVLIFQKFSGKKGSKGGFSG